MDLKTTHSGFAGKSLVEKIRDDLDEVFNDPDSQYDSDRDEFADIADDKFAEGLAHALGVLRGTDADTEWKLAKERYNEKQAAPTDLEIVAQVAEDYGA